MAKSKNHTSHNQSAKAHKNGAERRVAPCRPGQGLAECWGTDAGVQRVPGSPPHASDALTRRPPC